MAEAPPVGRQAGLPRGPAQARDSFLAGCGLPAAWRGSARWCVMQTGFGHGREFLATWQAWRDDPDRPRLLHYLATESCPADAADLRRIDDGNADSSGLAALLADAWWGLEPGTHRMDFDGGRVLLTLLVGPGPAPLRGLDRWVDSVFFDAPVADAQAWMQPVARCCRPGARLAAITTTDGVRTALASAGFAIRADDGEPGAGMQATLVHLPARHVQPPPVRPSQAVVVGAGLAGAACARALALRGWQVTVLDAAAGPAAGASGVPAGLFAPHVSADDAVLSRISRAGVRALHCAASALLERGLDWDDGGVDQVRPDAAPLRHAHAGWLRPARLVQALLQTPGIQVRYGAALDALPAGVPLTVIAAGHRSGRLLGGGMASCLQPVAGQVSWGPTDEAAGTPRNGHGHFLPRVPDGTGTAFWLAGASFERDSQQVTVEPAQALRVRSDNQRRLGELCPDLAAGLPARFADAHDWRGVRGTSPDRLPIVGPWPVDGDGAVWACTGLGARGITTALLCADLLVARLHHEPLPVAPRLAQSLSTERIARRIEKPHKQTAKSS